MKFPVAVYVVEVEVGSPRGYGAITGLLMKSTQQVVVVLCAGLLHIRCCCLRYHSCVLLFSTNQIHPQTLVHLLLQTSRQRWMPCTLKMFSSDGGLLI